MNDFTNVDPLVPATGKKNHKKKKRVRSVASSEAEIAPPIEQPRVEHSSGEKKPKKKKRTRSVDSSEAEIAPSTEQPPDAFMFAFIGGTSKTITGDAFKDDEVGLEDTVDPSDPEVLAFQQDMESVRTGATGECHCYRFETYE